MFPPCVARILKYRVVAKRQLELAHFWSIDDMATPTPTLQTALVEETSGFGCGPGPPGHCIHCIQEMPGKTH